MAPTRGVRGEDRATIRSAHGRRDSGAGLHGAEMGRDPRAQSEGCAAETGDAVHGQGIPDGGMQVKCPKSGKVRHVPVAKRVRPIVLEHIKGKDPDDLVFTTRRGAQLNKGNLKRAVHWKELSQGRRLHDLRHTAATEWLRHGVDVLVVKEWLGHSSLAVTQRYVHYLGTDADIAAVMKLDD